MWTGPHIRTGVSRAANSLRLLNIIGLAVSVLIGGAYAVEVDSDCGEGFAYIAAIKCTGADDAPVVLSCIPRPLRSDICELPKTTFAQALCQSAGKVKRRDVEPSLVETISGCYQIGPGRLEDFGVNFPAAGLPEPQYDALCEQLRVAFAASDSVLTPDLNLVREGFEGTDPLSAWTVTVDPDPADGSIPEELPFDTAADVGSVYVKCGDIATLDGEDEPLAGVQVAYEGDCAVIVQAGCTVNMLSRQFTVVPKVLTECELQAYRLTLAYAWTNVEAAFGFAGIFRDEATLSVSINGGPYQVVAAKQVPDASLSEYQTISIDLGQPYVGQVVNVAIKVEVASAGDCLLDSYIILDDIGIEAVAAPVADE